MHGSRHKRFSCLKTENIEWHITCMYVRNGTGSSHFLANSRLLVSVPLWYYTKIWLNPTADHNQKQNCYVEPSDIDDNISHCLYQTENNLNFSFIKIITSHQNLLLHITSPKPKTTKMFSCLKPTQRFSDFLWWTVQAERKKKVTKLHLLQKLLIKSCYIQLSKASSSSLARRTWVV
jgi:hypothetical protein